MSRCPRPPDRMVQVQLAAETVLLDEATRIIHELVDDHADDFVTYRLLRTIVYGQA